MRRKSILEAKLRLVMRWAASLSPSVVAHLKYPFEHRLMKRRIRESKLSATPSILFFTTHKCASSFMPKLFAYLCKHRLSLKTADLISYLTYTLDATQEAHGFLSKTPYPLHRSGVLYGPFRFFVPVPCMEDYKIILMLRDPRDIIVSNYYSTAFSHPIPINPDKQKVYLARRNRVLKMTVEEYALDQADFWRRRLELYAERLLPRDNVTFLKYEDMILHTDKWFSELSTGLEITLTPKDKKIIDEMGGFGSDCTEDASSHIRKAIPGDYKNKLSYETQEILNTRLASVLRSFNYE